jgi:MFS family permease
MTPHRNNMILFWASFMTLIAAGMGFSIRGDILGDWGRDFGFTQTELGIITGQGLAGFGITIIFFSFFADVVGYGKLMIIGFLLHTLSVVLTLAAPLAYRYYDKTGAFYCLYLGAWSFSLANGTCEAVINPLTASLFPKNKTHWLNILHAGWPGGLVLGAVVGWVLNRLVDAGVPGITWEVRWGIVFAPMFLYGVLMLGRRFPTSEAKKSGISVRAMMEEVGLLGAVVVVALLGLWLSSDVLPGLLGLVGLPEKLGWLGWVLAGGLWIVFGSFSRFRLGHWMLAFLYILHGLIGYVELGTDSWIQDITKTVLSNEKFLGMGGKDLALVAFIWVNVLMFTLRFFAGPLVHKISPVGLLFASAVIGTTGLWMLGLPATNTTWLWLGAATVYGIGKTFYWPTMLGVISERFPRGGALALGFSGGVGMLAAGLLGGPGIGYFQDYAAVQKLGDDPAYGRYKSYKTREKPTYDDYYELDSEGHKIPAKKGFLTITGLFPKVAGLDGARVGTLLGDPGKDNGLGQKLKTDIKNFTSRGSSLKDNPALFNLNEWWQTEGKPNSAHDEPVIEAARLHGGKQALSWTAFVPGAMAVGYLLLVFYFLIRGGYKAEVLIGHAAVDEEFTGGTEGPGEG